MSKSCFLYLLIFVMTGFISEVFGQNYTSLGDGSWTTQANWQNTSGWGSSTPPLSGQGSGTISVVHNLTITGNYSSGSATLNVGSGRSLTITGNLTVGGGSTINVSGTLIVNGNITLNSVLNILPGGQVIADNNVYVNSSNYLRVGTNVAPPPYADLIVKQDLISQGSGDVVVNRNGRVAVFGNVTDSGGGGTLLTINNGGQVYVNGDINYTGGSSSITNNNTSNPFGLYVNGTVSSSGGGGSATNNYGDETTLYNTNYPFYEWVQSHFGPLPVTITYFKVKEVSDLGVALEWETAFQQNFDKFEIERSIDGINYETIGEVKGAGNSNELLSYSFVDKYPLSGRNYYRLKSIDLDHSFEYSRVVFAQVETSLDIKVYPNPGTGAFINLKSNFTPQENDMVIVYDAMGVEVTRVSVLSSQERIVFNSTLKPGSYILKYYSDNFEKAIRIITR